MAKKHIISQDLNKSIDIKHGDATWIVKEGVTVEGPAFDSAINNSFGHDNVRFVIAGHLTTQDSSQTWGLIDSGNQTRVTVTETGEIDSETGMRLSGRDALLSNDGHIWGEGNGLELMGKRFRVENSGTIRSDAADGNAMSIGDTAFGRIINETDGILTGQVYSQSTKGITFINKGLVSDTTSIYDIQLGDGVDRLVNRGKINGSADLGAGDDIADMRSGKIDGAARGNLGNDTFIMKSPNAEVYESSGQGIDTMKTFASFNAKLNNVGEIERFVAVGKADLTIVANAYDNVVKGNTGNNTLDGYTGDDDLFGGKGADYFSFTTGHGSDRIMDFQNGEDRVFVSGWLNDFGDVESIAEQAGKDVVLTMGSDELIFKDTKLSELDAGDFIF